MEPVVRVTCRAEELPEIERNLKDLGYVHIRVCAAPTDLSDYFVTAYRTYNLALPLGK